jgi:hypothetical protein
MFKEFYTKNKQHIIIVALFMAISLAYCYPVLSGKRLNQNDDLSAKALNVEAEKYSKKTGEFVGWTNSMFSGMPTSVGYNGPTNYSISVIYMFANTFKGFSFDVIFWSLIGMYILFCALGINPWLGALGSFIFAFSSFNILSLEAGHVQKMFNISFIPLLLGGIYLIFQKRYVWGFIAVAFGVNYQVGLAHYQVTYYAAIAGVIVCIFYGVKWIIEKEFKALGIAVGLLLLGAVFGSLPNITVLNTYYASHETTRGGASELTQTENSSPDVANKDGLDFEYATSWSYGIDESFTFLVPNALGGDGKNLAYEFDKRGQPKPKKDSETFSALQQNVTDNNQYSQLAGAARGYWGDQPFVGGPIYFGAIVCFLAIFGIIVSKRNEKWWILAVTILFLFLAWGRHSFLYRIFFDYLPIFNKFRTPSMALGVVQIGFSLLAILGIVEVFRTPNEDKQKLTKPLLYVGAGFGVLLLIFSTAPSIFLDFISDRESQLSNEGSLPDWLLSAMAEDRAALVKADAIRSLIFIGLAFLLLWLYIKGKIEKVNYALIGVAVLVVIDLWGFNLRYLNKEKFVTPRQIKSSIAPSQADAAILQDPDPHFRVLNLTSSNPFSDYITSYHHHSIGGYHGAKLRKYQELIENQINTMNPSVLAMLNTKYLIVDGGQQGAVVQPPIKNPMGNAWFVEQVKVVENGDQEMAALSVDSTNTFEPAKEVIVQKKNLPENLKGFQPKNSASSSISLVEYAPHKLKYQSKASSAQVAVFSEIFYQQPDDDGWKAFIDGKPAEHFRANFVLRAMKVPAGEHIIEFKYDASKSLIRVKLSFVFFLLLVIISIGAVYLKKKGKLKWKGQQEITE